MCNYNFKELNEAKKMEIVESIISSVSSYIIMIKTAMDNDSYFEKRYDAIEPDEYLGKAELNVTAGDVVETIGGMFYTYLKVLDALVDNTDDEIYDETYKVIHEFLETIAEKPEKVAN